MCFGELALLRCRGCGAVADEELCHCCAVTLEADFAMPLASDSQVLQSGGVGGRGLSRLQGSTHQQAVMYGLQHQGVCQRAEEGLEGSGGGDVSGSSQSSFDSPSSYLISPIQQRVTLVRTRVPTFLNDFDVHTESDTDNLFSQAPNIAIYDIQL